MMANHQNVWKWWLMAFIVFLFHTNDYAKNAPFFNPGIKIGYNFGKLHGFVLGIESSLGLSSWDINDNSTWSFAGIVCGYSHCFRKGNNNFIYLEGEYGKVGLGGGSLGLLFNPEMNCCNPYLRVFIGMIGYFSFRYTIGQLPNELSIVGKLPLTTNTPVLD
jgi:hypothetical protein